MNPFGAGVGVGVGIAPLVGVCALIIAGCSDELAPAPVIESPASSGDATASATTGGAEPARPAPVRGPSGQGNAGQGSPGQGNSGQGSPGQGNAGSNGGGHVASGSTPASRPPAHKPIEAGTAPPQGEQLAVTLPPEVLETINDPRYAEFRAQCRPYLQLRADMRPLEIALATGTATPEQVAQFMALDAQLTEELERLNAYIWQDHHSSEARRAMAMIMTQPLQ